MTTSFKNAYNLLNKKQREAVDTIDGPLMVIAGPGTGKTQLLSTRAAQIISTGNANPGNILCLTYTEAGAHEMRERMIRIMGPAGADISVHTFHSFGTSIINTYPEYFSRERALTALDDLGRYRIYEQLLSKLPLRHPLAVRGENEQFIRRHAVEEAVRAFKQDGIQPAELRKIHASNQQQLLKLQPLLSELFSTTLSSKRLPSIQEHVVKQQDEQADDKSLSAVLLSGLLEAVEDAIELGQTKPIGAWRDSHTVIKDGQRVFKSTSQAEIFADTISLYEKYQNALITEGRYDYEDMIIWATTALQDNSDLLLDVAERYQYIMVDEYQDTNGAQNKLLITLLSAHPTDAPNIMVVGDDDQAIMRFQGAELSGMVQFIRTYSPQIIVLEDNYRSGQKILDASRHIIQQSSERIESVMPELGVTKQLTAHSEPAKVTIEHMQSVSPAAQYAAAARSVQKLLADGISPTEIAVIGRKHSELAAFVPHLSALGITTDYDNHENILDYPLITDAIRLAQLIVALTNNPVRAQTLLPGVLAASYWHLPALAIYEIAASAKVQDLSWLDTMLQSKNEQWQKISEWLIAAADNCLTGNFTQCFDLLIGRSILTATRLKRSPFSQYASPDSEQYMTILSHLLCLRNTVLAARPSATGMHDLLEVVQEYKLSGIRIIDANPVLRGDSKGVQVMSAHGAKGREFDHVIILSAIDTVWGSRARGQNQRIRLPENLALYPAGDADSDRLRLLYVAMTRAKSHIQLYSYAANDEGKQVPPLSYLQTGIELNNWATPTLVKEESSDLIQALETTWLPHAQPPQRSLENVLQPLLKNFRLSASALRNFIDIRYAGPQACIESSVLKFPSPYNAHSALGSATHKTLEKAYQAYANNKPLSRGQLLQIFDTVLDTSGLTETELQPVRVHGHQFLPKFIASFSVSDFPRITATEQYTIATIASVKVPISGAIDAISKTDKGIEIIDYKTGNPPQGGWDSKGLSDSKKAGLHFYRQQLLFYKILLEESKAIDSPVSCAELIFVEPTENPDTAFARLTIEEFTDNEITRVKQLALAVYQHITRGELPDTSGYSKDYNGIIAFEEYLLNTL
ncbi:MAG: ATP-dependent DNA helicase [Patescibacteria group bacterium]|nr:ATP-dependent DNA helicase [Patescibacteria group bacterium]